MLKLTLKNAIFMHVTWQSTIVDGLGSNNECMRKKVSGTAAYISFDLLFVTIELGTSALGPASFNFTCIRYHFIISIFWGFLFGHFGMSKGARTAREAMIVDEKNRVPCRAYVIQTIDRPVNCALVFTLRVQPRGASPSPPTNNFVRVHGPRFLTPPPAHQKPLRDFSSVGFQECQHLYQN